MTPKEKAEELIMKFKNSENEYGLSNVRDMFSAIDCALIAVYEAEKSEYNVLIKFGFVTKNYKSDYWQQVKQELDSRLSTSTSIP